MTNGDSKLELERLGHVTRQGHALEVRGHRGDASLCFGNRTDVQVQGHALDTEDRNGFYCQIQTIKTGV